MSDSLGLLTAIYRDGRVYIGGKSYAAGTFAVHLLNQYYKRIPLPGLPYSGSTIGMCRSSLPPDI
ncbi:MAG: hypothetical protein ACLR01_14040 [Vescimonas sp.]